MVKGWWEASELPFLFPIQKKKCSKADAFPDEKFIKILILSYLIWVINLKT